MTDERLKQLVTDAKNNTSGITRDVLAYLTGRLKKDYPEISKLLKTILEETIEEQLEYEEDLVNKAIDTTLRMRKKENKITKEYIKEEFIKDDYKITYDKLKQEIYKKMNEESITYHEANDLFNYLNALYDEECNKEDCQEGWNKYE